MTHTPGPWTYFPDDERCIVYDLSGEHVVCFGHDYDEYGSISSVANARLIAAAPEMLAMLRRLADAADSLAEHGNLNFADDAIDEARALLAKIDGGAA